MTARMFPVYAQGDVLVLRRRADARHPLRGADRRRARRRRGHRPRADLPAPARRAALLPLRRRRPQLRSRRRRTARADDDRAHGHPPRALDGIRARARRGTRRPGRLGAPARLPRRVFACSPLERKPMLVDFVPSATPRPAPLVGHHGRTSTRLTDGASPRCSPAPATAARRHRPPRERTATRRRRPHRPNRRLRCRPVTASGGPRRSDPGRRSTRDTQRPYGARSTRLAVLRGSAGRGDCAFTCQEHSNSMYRPRNKRRCGAHAPRPDEARRPCVCASMGPIPPPPPRNAGQGRLGPRPVPVGGAPAGSTAHASSSPIGAGATSTARGRTISVVCDGREYATRQRSDDVKGQVAPFRVSSADRRDQQRTERWPDSARHPVSGPTTRIAAATARPIMKPPIPPVPDYRQPGP